MALSYPFYFYSGRQGYFLILFMTIYSLVRMLDVYGSSLVKILHGYKRMAICGIIAILFALPLWEVNGTGLLIVHE